MATWTEIFPDVDGPPVRGNPAEFDGVADDFAAMQAQAEEIVSKFAQIKSSAGAAEIQGSVADALRRFVEDVSSRLDSLPAVSGAASGVFQIHATGLRDLRTKVDQALARAQTKWAAQRAAAADLDAAQGAAGQLQRQLDGMAPDDPNRSVVQGQFDQANGNASSLDGQVGGLAADLRGSRHEWDALAGEEQALRDTTAHQLDDIDLRSLEDPGFFQSIGEDLVEFAVWVYNVTGIDDLVEAIVAACQGDWANAFWRFRDFLDKAMLIVGVIALFVCPALTIVLLIGASIKLAVDVGLYASGTADPKTGRTISLVDLAFDTADVVLGAFSVSSYAKATKAAELGGAGPKTTLTKTKELVGDGKTFARDASSRNGLLTKYGMPQVGRHRVGGPGRAGIVKFTARSTANTYAVLNSGRGLVTQGVKADGELTDRPDVSLFEAQAHPSRSTRPILGPVDPWKAGKTAGKILTTAWK